MQTSEYHGFARRFRFPDWPLRAAGIWTWPLLASLLLHMCLFWPTDRRAPTAGSFAGSTLQSAALRAELQQADVRSVPSSTTVHAAPTARPTAKRTVRPATIAAASAKAERASTSPRISAPLPQGAHPSPAPIPAISAIAPHARAEHYLSSRSADPAAVSQRTMSASTERLVESQGLDAGAVRAYRVGMARAMAGRLGEASATETALSVEVGVAVSALGSVDKLALARSSGNDAFDAQLLASLRAVAAGVPVPGRLLGRPFVILLRFEATPASGAKSISGAVR